MAKMALSKVSTRVRIALSIAVVIVLLLIGGFAWWLTRDATVKGDRARARDTGAVIEVANESNSDIVQSDAKKETESALSQQEGAAQSIEEPSHTGIHSNENVGGGSTKSGVPQSDGEPSHTEDALSAVNVAKL